MKKFIKKEANPSIGNYRTVDQEIMGQGFYTE